MSQFKNIILVGVALTPYFATANVEQADHNAFSTQCTIKPVKDKAVADKPYLCTIQDFAGPWVVSFSSVGGLAGRPVVGQSISGNMQIEFDQCGHGTVNLYEASVYAGVPGELSHISIPPGQAEARLVLTRPQIGAGEITIREPGGSQTVGFVATMMEGATGITIQRLEAHEVRVVIDPSNKEGSLTPLLDVTTSFEFIKQRLPRR